MKRSSVLFITFLLPLAVDVFAQSVPSLINYQGKLTDASGNPLANGVYGVAFRIWPNRVQTAGEQLIWGQEYTNVAIASGTFNVILGGSPGIALPGAAVNDLSFAFTNPSRFLGLTVSRGTNGSAIPNALEILPRQQFLTTPFAFTAGFASNSAEATHTELASRALVADFATNVPDSSITLPKLATRPIGASVEAGGLALSDIQVTFGTEVYDHFVAVPNLRVSIRTTGRPVVAFLTAGDGNNSSSIYGRANCGNPGFLILFRRDDSVDVARERSYERLGSGTDLRHFLPVSAFRFLDVQAPAGLHTYSIHLMALTCDGLSYTAAFVDNVRLAVYEF